MTVLYSIGKNTIWFLIALIPGGICIWALKHAFDHDWLPAIASASIVMALTFYYIWDDVDTPEERGDNVYYLGLLYTLISLIFSLIELFGTRDAGTLAPDKLYLLLENFGIALISTVAGILGRILVLNWSQSTTKTTDLAGMPSLVTSRALLGEANTQISRNDIYPILHELNRAVNALARFHQIVRQYASDTQALMHDHSENLRKDSLQFRKSLEESNQTFINTLQQNTDQFCYELKSSAQVTLKTVGDSFDSIASTSKTHITSVQAIQESQFKELRQMTHKFNDELQITSKESINGIGQNLEIATSQVSNLINTYTKSYDQIIAKLYGMESALEKNLLNLDMLCKKTSTVAESIATLEANLEKTCSSLITLRTVSESTVNMLETLSKLESMTTEQASRNIELHKNLTESTRSMDQEIQRTTNSLSSLASEAKKRLEDLDKSRKWFIFNRK